MSDVTLLRKLTRKSTLKFGKHSDLTIDMLISLAKINYLRWIYYNCSNITFFDDVLEQLKITNDFVIDKPGVNPELYEKLKEFVVKDLPEKALQRIEHKKKKIATKNIRGQASSKRNFENQKFSKSNLARKNQGH